MNLAHLITEEQILDDMQSTEHFLALAELVDHLESKNLLTGVGVTRESVMEAVRDREDQTTTGIGAGVAIPHAFVPGLESVLAVVGRSKEGIDFESIDNVPVNLVVLFVVPEDQYQTHLETLASIAKMLSDGETRARLTDAADSPAILQVIKDRFGG